MVQDKSFLNSDALQSFQSAAEVIIFFYFFSPSTKEFKAFLIAKDLERFSLDKEGTN